MDLEKVKKNYGWDPLKGDYTKHDVYEERKILRKRKIRNTILTVIYIAILIISIFITYFQFYKST